MNKTNVLVGLLAVSLSANVFFVGYGATRLMSGPHEMGGRHGPRMAGPDGGMDKAISHLDPKYQEQIRKIVDNHRENVRTDMEEMRGLFEQIGPTLSAPTFDADKLAKLSSEIDKHDKAMKSNMAAMMTTIAKTLPDDQRVAFFKEMFDNMPKHGFRGGPPDRGPGGDDRHGPHDRGGPDSHDPEDDAPGDLPPPEAVR